jgi:glycosyltransferase involved in cell wall biosynthesis
MFVFSYLPVFMLGIDSELIDIYQKHNIFVLPSYFEGQPLAMLEAAALGLAIVTTEVCGMRDFIDHNQNGVLVAPGDSESLAAAIIALSNRPQEVRRLGSAAQINVQRFTWDAVAADMLNAYEAAACRQKRVA